MRDNPDYSAPGLRWAADLLAENPWATLVTNGAGGAAPVVSHYPFLVETAADDHLAVVSHVGRPDEALHGLGEQESCVVVHGPSGYISPGWYGVPVAVPTWNFATAHLYGVPEILSDEENLAVLDRLVASFEERMPEPFLMRRTLENAAYAERIVAGTVGFRMDVTRIEAKEKMSQDKPPEVFDRIVAALRSDGPYANPRLAARMRSVRE